MAHEGMAKRTRWPLRWRAALPQFPQEPVQAAQKLSVGDDILELSQLGKDLLPMQGTSLQMTPLASWAVLRPTFCKGFAQ